MLSRFVYPSAVAILLSPIVLAGCGGLAPRMERSIGAADTPDPVEILRDLAANDGAIHSFRAAGRFTLESPELDSIQKFRQGRILFRRPADLYVQGNHRVTNVPLFKLWCRGDEFLLEVPTNSQQNYYSIEGEEFTSVPFPVSPSDIAREMFLSEDWGTLPAKEVRVVGFDSELNVAKLVIGPARNPRRTIEVTKMDPAAPSWVVVKNVRLDEDGKAIAEITLQDYVVAESIRFPSKVDAWFPTEATRMTFEMSNIRPNLPLGDELFDIDARARELQLGAGAKESR